MPGGITQMFSPTDYLMALPITLLTLFALGILLIDLMLPAEQKWVNAVTALVGLGFAAVAIWKILNYLTTFKLLGQPALANSMLVDRFAIYFWGLFLGGRCHRHRGLGALHGD